MMEFFHEWILKPEYLAAWFQAFAAIVALFISGLAVLRTEDVARRRDRLERYGVAVAVYPEVEMLKISIQNVRDGIARLKEELGGQVGQSVGAHLQAIARIDIPPMLERNTDRLFVLGEVAGPSCLHLVRLILQYNSVVEAVASRVMLLNAAQWVTAVDKLEYHLSLLDNVIEKCQHEVQPIHDAIKG